MNRKLFGSGLGIFSLGIAGVLGAARAETLEEKEVRETFSAFADAVKAKDAQMIWKLLDKESQMAAARAARSVLATYDKANAEEKAKLEKALGLSGVELGKLTGEGFLKTKGFHGKYHEVHGSKIDTITVQDKRATVNYTEEDGDKEKLRMIFQDGKWKVSAPMPPVPQL
ncbi:MAG TPA: hypothetical protein VGY77_08975 [Gemmataceae bacterium]|nr:hypothetical protein [Gemmataceae bacterium]